MLLSPQRSITYGPVRSRRLGRSLGINLLPARRKICNFNCRYCQYGWTDRALLASATGSDFPAVGEVLGAVETAVRYLDAPPAYLTFSGNGEPTLHPRFAQIVDGIEDLRRRLAPGARTAILSNASRVVVPEVRVALARLDVRIMKLDAGTEAGFQRMSGPPEGLTLDAVADGLRLLPETTLQTLFTGGPLGNLDAQEVDAWLGRVARIRPHAVQIYTLDRGAPCDLITPAGREELQAVRARLAALGVASEAF
jgi:wyosine [tRNA(Phe)-imidazoG37] synthetase (radical SAM superfamily)